MANTTRLQRAATMRSTSVQLGMHPGHWQTDYRGCFTPFSQEERTTLRGALNEQCKKELRAVNFNLGMSEYMQWESDTTLNARRATTLPRPSSAPIRSKHRPDLSMYKCNWPCENELNSADWMSEKQRAFHNFSNQEKAQMRAISGDEVKKAATSTNIFCSERQAHMQSNSTRSFTNLPKSRRPQTAKSVARPQDWAVKCALSADENASFGSSPKTWTSLYKKGFQEYTHQEMCKAKADTAKPVDPRKVNITFGFDSIRKIPVQS